MNIDRVYGHPSWQAKIGMIYEGECEGYRRTQTAKRFGYTRQRYHQILKQFLQGGAEALKGYKRGPKTNYRRTEEVVRQVIRYDYPAKSRNRSKAIA